MLCTMRLNATHTIADCLRRKHLDVVNGAHEGGADDHAQIRQVHGQGKGWECSLFFFIRFVRFNF